MSGQDALMEALHEVIDPDLGINIVDLGFVRKAIVDAGAAELELTLTSPACPLTSIISDQIRAAIVDTGLVTDYHVRWVWTPPWTPAQVTDPGREQLRAIGFSL